MTVTPHTFGKVSTNMTLGNINLSTHAFRVLALTSAVTAMSAINDTASTMTDVKASLGFTEVVTSAGGSNYTQNANSHLSGQAISSPTWNQKTTTVAAGSNAVNTSTFAGAGVLNVATTAPATGPAFPASGTIEVATGTSNAVITYTGISGTTFTGCTTTSGGGVLSTGGAVTSADHVFTFTSATSPVWTTAAAGFAPTILVFFDDNGATDATNYALAWHDLGGASPGGGGPWTYTIAATGIFSSTAN